VPVLVVGGGEVAIRKVRTLLEAGAAVTVVAPHFHEELAALRAKSLRRVARAFKSADLKNKHMVFAATDNPALNTEIAARCRKARVLVNVATPPDAGNFHVPATIRRGPLTIAISTGGASAALARSLREHLETQLGDEWSILAGLLEARRKNILRLVKDPETRRELLSELGSARWARRIRQNGETAAAREMDALINRSASQPGILAERGVRA